MNKPSEAAILIGMLALGSMSDYLPSGRLAGRPRGDGRACQNLGCGEQLPPGRPRYCRQCRDKLGDYRPDSNTAQ